MSSFTDDEKRSRVSAGGRSDSNTAAPTRTLLKMLDEQAGSGYVTPEIASNMSQYTREYEYNEVNATDYFASNFPSLLTHLGPEASHKTKRKGRKKKEKSAENQTQLNKPKRDKEYVSFTEHMRRKNEAQWLRIEAVAKEKLEWYEKYTEEMQTKLHRQRRDINRRTEKLLQSLEIQEEKKKEDRIFESPYGRMWRHHRSMQRRAFSLEPMRQRKLLNLSGSQSNVKQTIT